ncbi:MAG: NAD-dependent deacylase [Kiritimatiellae bacterium]|nr:NAD-dependent deacylase [Kiritimatiellia bacterium]
MNDKIKQLIELLRNADSIAVLTGAGISTSSGIPDFRSAGGLYADERNINVFDLGTFHREPTLYYNFARKFYPLVRQAQPNAAHHKLAEWLKRDKRVTIITQNIDDYHQRAGSAPVHTVHGTFITSICTTCNKVVQTEELLPVIERGELPCCICGGIYKPEVTFFGEMLPEQEWNASMTAISGSDLLLVIGTSLTVYPAASLPSCRKPRTPLVIINRDPTPLDQEAAIVINQDICEVMEAL